MANHLIHSGSVATARLLDDIYRLRAEVFRENLGWDVATLCQREIDEFDTERAIYGAITDEQGELEGCFRLLPTTDRYMLKSVFPELLHGEAAPSDPRVLESSRFAVKPSILKGRGIQGLHEVTAHLLISQIDYCLTHHIHTVVSVTDLRFERVLRSAGLPCERYGAPLTIGATKAVAGFMHPTPQALASVWTVYNDLRRRRSEDTTNQAA
jgi:acyl homoserine lactone synthase